MIDFEKIAEKCLKHECQGTFIIDHRGKKRYVNSKHLQKDHVGNLYISDIFARFNGYGISAFGSFRIITFCKNIFVV